MDKYQAEINELVSTIAHLKTRTSDRKNYSRGGGQNKYQSDMYDLRVAQDRLLLVRGQLYKLQGKVVN